MTDLKTNMASTVVSIQETQKSVMESPAALHFKGITIIPVAFSRLNLSAARAL